METEQAIKKQEAKIKRLEKKLEKMGWMVPPPIRLETAQYLATQRDKLDEMRKVNV